jgi:hypothetical protein
MSAAAACSGLLHLFQVRLARILSSVCKLASAPSIDLTISVRHTFNSVALLNASASIPGISIPSVLPLFRVFAVDDVRLFKLVRIVVLGVVVIALPVLQRFV